MSRFVLTGNHGGKPLRYEVRPGTQVVGRSSDCDLPVPDGAISRRHAELILGKDRLRVRDLGSTNGTFVNDERLDGEREIRRGDRVRFGNLVLALAEQETAQLGGFAPEGTMVTMATSMREIRESRAGSRTESLLAAVHEAGQLLSRSLPLQELYEDSLELLQRFIPANRILILSGDEGETPEVVAARVAGSSADAPLRMSQTMMREIMEEGKSLLTADASKDERFNAAQSIIQTGIHAAMGAPLFDNDRILGAIYVDSRNPVVTYQAEDLRLLTLIGNMIAVKITNSRLEQADREREQLRRELNLAAQIQRNLLPRRLPKIDGYGVFTHQTPCNEVGGDLFDVRPGAGDRYWVVLGDIAGKGIGAAMLMSNVMASLQILEEEMDDPLELVSRLEMHLLQHVEAGQYLTLFAGLLDPGTGTLEYVNAGHCPPMILCQPGRICQELPSTGVPVALFPGLPREKSTITLEPGSTLLVFSDGISETEAEGVQYDEGPMRKFFDELLADPDLPDPEALGTRFLGDVTAYRGEAPAVDDLTLVVVGRS